MVAPHHFPSLVEGPAQAVLIVGAGLSCPDIPLVNGLTKKLDEFANSIGVSISLPRDDEYFYALAEEVLKKLGDTDENRLQLAEKLGLLDDRRWFGEIGVHFSGSTPRHRAIARFAVEKRLRSIISLNWDALLETALESVGLTSGSNVARPWDISNSSFGVQNSQNSVDSAIHSYSKRRVMASN